MMNVPRYGFLLPMLLAPMVPAGYLLGGAWTFLLPVVVWGVLPFADWAAGVDTRNPSPESVRGLDDDVFYRWAVWVHVPLTVGLIVWASWVQAAATPVEWAGLAVSTGLVSGAVGITVAHELGHRRSRVERWLARVLLAFVAYGHFLIEHNKGHHARVATPADPATARHGEGFWRFFPRTLVGQFRSALHIDRRATLASVTASLGVALVLGLAFGWMAVTFFALQAFGAVMQLELVNYVEHYGLERREVAPGRYERVTARHSWNSSNRVSNLLLFNLQRHAHHHIQQGRRYPVLEHIDAAPQLPAGYLSMVPLALFPPLWHRVMDARVRRARALPDADA